MTVLKITKSVVDHVAHPAKGQRLYMDATLKGFGLLVGAKSKTYIAQRDIGGRAVRFTIGRHGLVSTAQARKEAEDALNLMRKGIDPNKAKQAAKDRTVTLGESAALYLSGLSGRSPKTIDGFRDSMRLYFKDWQDKPLAEISRKMVYDRHQRIGKTRGTYAANAAMRAFRATYNRAMRQHEDLPPNPIVNVDWFPEKPRDAAITADRLPAWYADVMAIKNPVRRDYYLFVQFSGLRRQSAAEIRWAHIDLDAGNLLVPNPKGGAARAFVLPLSDFLVKILLRRKSENDLIAEDSPWVFPAAGTKAGHIAEPKLSPKEKAAMAVPFSIHGLRHTWMSAANAAGLSPYDMKMLANHSLPKGDVTAGYISPHTEALRASQQRVTDYLRTACKIGD
ncbi:tyrosine-type recombinase/integrase [Magnetospira thiophila]